MRWRVLGFASACALGEVFGVADQDALAFETDPATVGEGRECLVHGFAGCADELGDLLLGEVVVDPQGAAFLGSEAVGQLQQRLGHASGDVGEDEVGEGGVGPAEAAGEDAEELFGDLRVVVDPLVEHTKICQITKLMIATLPLRKM